MCFLNTLRARPAYLNSQFALAYLFLDTARAAIRRTSRGSDFSALVIIVLHQAECLMLHADDELKKTSSGDSGRAIAKVKLARARTALEQAHTWSAAGRRFGRGLEHE